MNKPHGERDRLAVRCFNNLPPEMAEPRILGFRYGFDAATEIHQKRIERLREALNEHWLVEQITKWKHAWMDVKGTDERDRKNYFHRAFGVDANMKYDLARRIIAALQEETK